MNEKECIPSSERIFRSTKIVEIFTREFASAGQASQRTTTEDGNRQKATIEHLLEYRFALCECNAECMMYEEYDVWSNNSNNNNNHHQHHHQRQHNHCAAYIVVVVGCLTVALSKSYHTHTQSFRVFSVVSIIFCLFCACIQLSVWRYFWWPLI